MICAFGDLGWEVGHRHNCVRQMSESNRGGQPKLLPSGLVWFLAGSKLNSLGNCHLALTVWQHMTLDDMERLHKFSGI